MVSGAWVEGMTVEGITVEGEVVEGTTVEGEVVEGVIVEGVIVEGVIVEGPVVVGIPVSITIWDITLPGPSIATVMLDWVVFVNMFACTVVEVTLELLLFPTKPPAI